jgi:uncharacterized protein
MAPSYGRKSVGEGAGMKTWSWIVLAAALGAACPAAAASFDCARAGAPDERAICANRALNDKDVTLAVMLKLAERLVAMGQRGAMMDDQRAWLASRHGCRADVACLGRRYDGRIAQVQTVLDGVAAHGPF